MPDVKCAVTRVACNTSTGNQDITISGLGWTPKLAVFYLSYADTDGTLAAHSCMSVGFFDGTSGGYLSGYNVDASASSNAYVQGDFGTGAAANVIAISLSGW